eukprot:GHVU01113264.1.p1 GENE.GHVU01113264.1~~GHVU01113264.1.p1  ORF type:complete len:360 (+),score=63.29 GHVU01113264.1:2130-3209(+)
MKGTMRIITTCVVAAAWLAKPAQALWPLSKTPEVETLEGMKQLMDLFHKSNLVKDLNLAIDMGLHPIRGIIPGIDIDNDLIPKDSSCRTCVEKSANWIIQRTWERFDEFCKKAICPFIRAMCLKAHEHPKVATGFLMAEVKPYEMGYAYCLGKGVCHPKTDEDVLNNPPIKIGNKDDAASTATIFHPAVSAALHEIANGAETWAQLAKDEFKAQVDKFMGEECPPPITDFISSLKDKAECTCRCMHCVRAAGRMVMRLKIESVTVWCLTHKDSPVAQNMCKCAYQHPEVREVAIAIDRSMDVAAASCEFPIAYMHTLSQQGRPTPTRPAAMTCTWASYDVVIRCRHHHSDERPNMRSRL